MCLQCLQSPEEGAGSPLWNWSYRHFHVCCPIWVLGTNLGSSKRGAGGLLLTDESAPQPWATFLICRMKLVFIRGFKCWLHVGSFRSLCFLGCIQTISTRKEGRGREAAAAVFRAMGTQLCRHGETCWHRTVS